MNTLPYLFGEKTRFPYTRKQNTLIFAFTLMIIISQTFVAQDISNPDIRPITLTGSLITAAENYSIPGLQTNKPVNTARLYFNPTLTIYEVQFPFSFMFSTNERSYNQPFNQFGVSPRYKWFTVHAGYRSLQFSEFTLSDMLILGGGAEAKGEWLHGGAMYGRFKRSVEEDTSQNILPVYKRMGWAATAGFGSSANYFDFNVIHAWDDSTSLTNRPLKAFLFPEENLVLGAKSRMALIEGALAFEGELAGSANTRDRNLPEIQNADISAISSGIYNTKLSTRFNLAMKLAGIYNTEEYGVRLEYARVEPDYQTMGATYTQNDRQDITIAPSFQLFDRTLRASGSVGFRADNLYNDRAYTTNRVITSANLNWAPSQAFGVDGQYSNYSMSNSSAAFTVSDSTRVENVTESYSFSPRYLLLGEEVQHFFMIFITKQAYADRNVLTGQTGSNNVLTGVFSYIATVQSGFNFSSALQYTEVNTLFLTNIIRGMTLGIGKGFFDNSLNTNLSYSLNLTKASSESETDTQHLLSLSGIYRLSQVDSFDLRMQFNSYAAVNPNRASYSGTTTRLQYTRTFGFGTK